MSIEKLSKFFKITKKIEEKIDRYGNFKNESKDLLLKSNEASLEYAITLVPKTNVKYMRNMNFHEFPLRRLSIISSPDFKEETSAVIRTEDGFSINPKKLDKDADQFLIKFEIEYDIEDVVKDLVRRDHQIEAVGEGKNRYWLHAQLKEIKPLRDILRSTSLMDIPFVINVGIHQDIKTKFPKRRKTELELIAKWSRTVDRNKKEVLNIQHMQFKREKPGEKEITDVLRDLQALFMPIRFKSFIDVRQDFYYSDCFQGRDFYDDVPFKTFPKWMSVISRTDLSLEEPVAEGELIYKKLDFQDAIEKAIIKKRKKKRY